MFRSVSSDISNKVGHLGLYLLQHNVNVCSYNQVYELVYLICLFPQFSMLRSTNRVVTVVEFQAMHPKLDNILLQNTENRLPFFCFERFCQICKKNYAIILWGYLSNFRCPSCNVHDLPNLIQRPTSADQLSCNYAVLKVIT